MGHFCTECYITHVQSHFCASFRRKSLTLFRSSAFLPRFFEQFCALLRNSYSSFFRQKEKSFIKKKIYVRLFHFPHSLYLKICTTYGIYITFFFYSNSWTFIPYGGGQRDETHFRWHMARNCNFSHFIHANAYRLPGWEEKNISSIYY